MSTIDEVHWGGKDRLSNVEDAVKAIQTGGSIPASLTSVASRTAPHYDNSAALSDGTTQGGTSRMSHVALCSFHGPRLVYSNFYNAAGIETDGPNDITVAGAIEVNGSVFPVTFNGALQATIKPGASVVSDPVGVSFAKGTRFYSRTFVSVGAGLKFPRGSFVTGQGGGSNEGHNYPATASVGADLTPQGSAAVTVVNGTHIFAPTAILGLPKTGHVDSRTILIVGDSIAAGQGEDDTTKTNWGYIKRAINDAYPYLTLAYPSESLAGWVSSNGATCRRRVSLFDRVKPDLIICELGINSVKGGSGTINADLLTLWQFLANWDVPIYQTTLTPVTTSTDSWATTANQTVTANESLRTAANNYIRTAPAPLAGYIEVADLAETSRNSGIWNVAGGAWTADGTHPNSRGHAALAAALTSLNLGAATS